MRPVSRTLAATLAAALMTGVPMTRSVVFPAAGPVPAELDSQPASDGPPSDNAPPPTPRAQPDFDAPRTDTGDQREARVVTTSGGTFTGLLVERTRDMVVLKISGILTPIPIKDIARIETLLPNRDRYLQHKDALDPSDVRGRVNLARWLMSVEMLDEALIEITDATRLDPLDTRAADLHRLIEQQILLRDRTRDSIPSETPRTAEPRQRPPAFPLLTPEQINVIRVYELDLADPPRMTISRETITRLIEQYTGDPLIPVSREGRDALLRRRPDQIVELMFKLRARDFYPHVKVQQDPAAMRRFREDVHRGWLVNFCATSDCHGGAEAGKLWLNNRNPNTDATVYTNFLILDRFRLRADRGEKKGSPVPLIDYANPANSPLVQMALPTDESLFPHPTPFRPGKAPFKPLFRSQEDVRFRRAVEWIRTMHVPRPDYRVDYTPPTPPVPIANQPDQDTNLPIPQRPER
ncbi:MAG: hypothetical protein KF787_09040 [Phycisphaeraceae bacterium]|nr:hypothetical protein [Phycisphaerae bacterium]MBX3392779.1 hypothetical protein [Phycisphaeraceae bacterium]